MRRFLVSTCHAIAQRRLVCRRRQWRTTGASLSTKTTPGNEAKEFVLDHFDFHCGVQLSKVPLVYQTYGTLNETRSNVILYPTSYGAQHTDVDWLIGSILDPSKYYIVMINMFGNGLSFSPSNSQDYPLNDFYTTQYDNVRAQKSLLDHLGIEQLALIYGWSMGAQQAFHWGALYPERVQRIAALCGTAKTTDHNKIFLYSLRAALQADPAWDGSRFTRLPDRGLHTFTQIYASWAASQSYYKERYYLEWGYESLEDYLARGWEEGYRKRDPHILLAMIETWLRCDVSDNPVFEGDYAKAMASIQALTLVMPCTTDLYFTPEDCQAEAELLPNAEFRPIPSIWGHRAGNPYQHPEDEMFIRDAVAELLQKH